MLHLLISAALCWVSGLAVAAEFPGLYQAELNVASKDDPVRDEAFHHGIAMVMGRVVRTRDVSSAPVRTILARPEDYIESYEYAGSSGQGELHIKLNFDEARIQGHLRQKGIRLFGPQRPETLVWLAVMDGTLARMAGSEGTPDLESQVREAATAAGLPVQWPLGDLEDQQRLPPEQLAAPDAARVRQAALRYETPVILTGLMKRRSADAYEADWTVYLPDREERWKTPPGTAAQTLAAGLSGVYSRLAEELAPLAGAAAAELPLKVLGITSLEDINRVSDYLAKLAPVSKVEWQAVGNGDASFKLKAVGGRDFLRRHLLYGRLLKPEAGNEPGFSGLVCRLQR